MFVPFVQYLYHERTIIAILGLPKLFGGTKALDFGVVFGIFGRPIRWGNADTASASSFLKLRPMVHLIQKMIIEF